MHDVPIRAMFAGMTAIAIYSAKGGVGKTTLAVNLAWASATRSSRRTLLWDLDAQAAATFILATASPKASAREVIERALDPGDAIVPTAAEGSTCSAPMPRSAGSTRCSPRSTRRSGCAS